MIFKAAIARVVKKFSNFAVNCLICLTATIYLYGFTQQFIRQPSAPLMGAKIYTSGILYHCGHDRLRDFSQRQFADGDLSA